MISTPRPISTAQALDYFVKESQGFNQFFEHPEFRPEFAGALLPHLGLKEGHFDEQQYADFILGDFPAVKDGRIKRVYTAEADERCAYDITVSMPKCLSMQILLANDKRLFSVARRVNREIMQLFADYVVVRVTDKDGRMRRLRANGIAYATWWHISSRERTPGEGDVFETGTGADPHFHAHNIVSKLVLPVGSTDLMSFDSGTIAIAGASAIEYDDGDSARILQRELGAQL